jgi:HEAT repeat protein
MNQMYKNFKVTLKLHILFCILIMGIIVWQSASFIHAKRKTKDAKQELRQTYLNSIFDVISSSEADHRVEAIKISSKIGDRSAVPLLKRLLRGKNDRIKMEAAYALGKLGNSTGIPTVVGILKATPNISLNRKMKMIERARMLAKQTLRVRAAEIIGEIGNSSHIPLLKKIANNKNENTRLVDSSLIALAKLGDKSKIRVFTFALLRKDREARRQACYYLGELKEKSAVNNLRQLLKTWDKDIRAEAALALGKIGDKKSIPYVSKLLDDKESVVRMNACESLGMLGDKNFIPDIKKLLKDENGFVRLHACEALMRLEDFSGEDFLLRSLVSTDFDAKLESIQILAEFGKYNLLDKLEEIYSKEDNELLKLHIANTIVRIFDRKKISVQKKAISKTKGGEKE